MVTPKACQRKSWRSWGYFHAATVWAIGQVSSLKPFWPPQKSASSLLSSKELTVHLCVFGLDLGGAGPFYYLPLQTVYTVASHRKERETVLGEA